MRKLLVIVLLMLAGCHQTHSQLTVTVEPHTPTQVGNPSSPSSPPTTTTPPVDTNPTSPSPPTTSTPLPTPPPASFDISLTWTPPSQNTDGSPLTNLAGYRIFYGTSPNTMSTEIDYPNPAGNGYMISSVPAGTYYLAIAAYNTNHVQSALSNVVNISFP